MTKRTAAVVTLLAIFALSLLGAQVVGVTTQPVVMDDAHTAIMDVQTGHIVASDYPVCPPGAPPPCN